MKTLTYLLLFALLLPAQTAVRSRNKVGMRGRTVIGYPAAPEEFQDLYQFLLRRLKGKRVSYEQTWNGVPSGSFAKCMEVVPLAGPPPWTVANYYANYVTPWLNAARSMGVTCGKVQIGFPLLYPQYYIDQGFCTAPCTGAGTAYGLTKAMYDQLVVDIHAMGGVVIAQSQVAACANASVNTPNLCSWFAGLTWQQYMDGRAANVVNIAQMTHPPDYITYSSEPDNEGNKSGRTELQYSVVGQTTFMTNITALVDDIYTTLETAAPAGLHTTIKTGIGFLPSEYNFQPMLDLYTGTGTQAGKWPNTNCFDMHFHSVSTSGGANDTLANMDTIASTVTSSGRCLGMDEEWIDKSRVSEQTGGATAGSLATVIDARSDFSFWTQVEYEGTRMLLLFGTLNNAKYISMSQPQNYFTDLPYGYVPGCPIPSTSCTPSQYSSITTPQINAAIGPCAAGYPCSPTLTSRGKAFKTLITSF